MSLTRLRRDLNKEDERDLERGDTILHQVSMAQFLLTGLELEEAQYVFGFVTISMLVLYHLLTHLTDVLLL